MRLDLLHITEPQLLALDEISLLGLPEAISIPKQLIRSPEFNNTFKVVLNTRIQKNAWNEYRLNQSDAPTWEGFNCRILGLDTDQKEAFKTFVLNSRGQVITLTDFENRTWTGIITSPNLEIIARRDSCNYEVNFDFEGSVA